MSVSPSAASKQRKELLERQSAHIADLLVKEKNSTRNRYESE